MGNTVFTLLSRLVENKFLKVNKIGRRGYTDFLFKGKQSLQKFFGDELTQILEAQADAISDISIDNENYDFFKTTMNLSTSELYCEHRGEEFTFYAGMSKQSRPSKWLDEYEWSK